MSAGSDTNFNNSSDAERLHAIGVCSNNLQVADFRVIANKSMINDWKNICHIQNHRVNSEIDQNNAYCICVMIWQTKHQ